MFRQATNEEDLKAQVLSKFLRVQGEAEHLFDRGSPWFALLKLETFVSSLVLSDEEYKEVDVIFDLISKIREDSKQVKGMTSDFTQHRRDQYKNSIAFYNFHKVLRSITKVLRDSGYYNFLLDGRKDFTDPSRGRKSFQRKM